MEIWSERSITPTGKIETETPEVKGRAVKNTAFQSGRGLRKDRPHPLFARCEFRGLVHLAHSIQFRLRRLQGKKLLLILNFRRGLLAGKSTKFWLSNKGSVGGWGCKG